MIYYIDSINGSDTNSGHEEHTPMKSLRAVYEKLPQAGEAAVLEAGAKILIGRGSRLSGGMTFQARGSADAPVIISAYGEGNLPIIDGEGALHALCLLNSQHVEISNLSLVNSGGQVDIRRGLEVASGGENHPGGELEGIRLRSLHVSNINAELGRESAGIYITNRYSKNPCRYKDLLIEDCDVSDTGACGIIFSSQYGKRPEIRSWDIQPLPFFPALGLIIRHNCVHDLPGDGMWISTTEGALLEYNTVFRTSYGTITQYAGMWPHNSDNCIMQYNYVYENRLGGGDGQGLDVDINCNNTIVQHNMSRENEGGFLLVCTDGEPDNFNRGTIVRHNTSINDGSVNSSGVKAEMKAGLGSDRGGGSLIAVKGIEVTGLHIYENTFYTDRGYANGTFDTLLWAKNHILVERNIFIDTGESSGRFVDNKDGEGNSTSNDAVNIVFRNNFKYY